MVPIVDITVLININSKDARVLQYRNAQAECQENQRILASAQAAYYAAEKDYALTVIDLYDTGLIEPLGCGSLDGGSWTDYEIADPSNDHFKWRCTVHVADAAYDHNSENYSSSGMNKTAAPAAPETPESLVVGSWAFPWGGIIEFYADGTGAWPGGDELTWKITDDRFEITDSEDTYSQNFEITDSVFKWLPDDPAKDSTFLVNINAKDARELQYVNARWQCRENQRILASAQAAYYAAEKDYAMTVKDLYNAGLISFLDAKCGSLDGGYWDDYEIADPSDDYFTFRCTVPVADAAFDHNSDK